MSDSYMPLAVAAKTIPPHRSGRPVSPSCLYRWTNEGCRGVRLKYTQVGSTRCVTQEQLDTFEQLTRLAEAKRVPISTVSTKIPIARRRAIDDAMDRLAKAGV